MNMVRNFKQILCMLLTVLLVLQAPLAVLAEEAAEF